MKYNTRTRRRLDGLAKHRSSNYFVRFAKDMSDYPSAPRILSEGDSWFNYPWYDLNDYIYGAGAFNVLRKERAGDELIDDMMSNAQLPRLERDINNWDFQLILLSAGGNDILGDSFKTLIKPGNQHDPASWVNEQTLDAMMINIRDHLVEFIGIAKCPVLTHTYDIPFPTGKPLKIFKIKKGPWIKNKLDDINTPVDTDFRRDIIAIMIHRFRDVLEGLKTAHAKFDYVDLIGTLTRESQWHNEIHPKSSKGFKLLADKMIPVVKQRLPDGFSTNATWRQLSRKHRTP